MSSQHTDGRTSSDRSIAEWAQLEVRRRRLAWLRSWFSGLRVGRATVRRRALSTKMLGLAILGPAVTLGYFAVDPEGFNTNLDRFSEAPLIGLIVLIAVAGILRLDLVCLVVGVFVRWLLKSRSTHLDSESPKATDDRQPTYDLRNIPRDCPLGHGPQSPRDGGCSKCGYPTRGRVLAPEEAKMAQEAAASLSVDDLADRLQNLYARYPDASRFPEIAAVIAHTLARSFLSDLPISRQSLRR